MKSIVIDCTNQLRRVIDTLGLPVPVDLEVNVGSPESTELLQLCRDRQVLLIEHTAIPAELLDQLPALKAMIFMGTGVGSYIDVDDARRRGIAVLTTPGYGNRAVAEHTLALMLAAARQVASMDRALRRGSWCPLSGLQLQGRKLAVIGMGGIGTTFADIAEALGMQVSAWNRTPRQHHAFEPDLDAALADADVVSLHLALNEDTRSLIDRRRLQLPSPGFILVNTARAALVEEQALLSGLASGRIGHAALDVFHQEPLAADNPWSRFDNVTLTAHAAYMTDDAYAELWRRSLRALESLELG